MRIAVYSWKNVGNLSQISSSIASQAISTGRNHELRFINANWELWDSKSNLKIGEGSVIGSKFSAKDNNINGSLFSYDLANGGRFDLNVKGFQNLKRGIAGGQRNRDIANALQSTFVDPFEIVIKRPSSRGRLEQREVLISNSEVRLNRFCPDCGAAQAVLDSKFCANCGAEKTTNDSKGTRSISPTIKEPEVLGATECEAINVCPICGGNDQLFKMSSLLDSGTTRTAGIAVGSVIGQRGLGVAGYQGISTSELVRQIGPPARPSFGVLRAYGYSLFACALSLGFYAVFSGWSWAGVFSMWLLSVFVAFIPMFPIWIIGESAWNKKKLKWDRDLPRYREVYFCVRDMKVIVNGTAQEASAARRKYFGFS